MILFKRMWDRVLLLLLLLHEPTADLDCKYTEQNIVFMLANERVHACSPLLVKLSSFPTLLGARHHADLVFLTQASIFTGIST